MPVELTAEEFEEAADEIVKALLESIQQEPLRESIAAARHSCTEEALDEFFDENDVVATLDADEETEGRLKKEVLRRMPGEIAKMAKETCVKFLSEETAEARKFVSTRWNNLRDKVHGKTERTKERLDAFVAPLAQRLKEKLEAIQNHTEETRREWRDPHPDDEEDDHHGR